jgi:hypothetical protein
MNLNGTSMVKKYEKEHKMVNNKLGKGVQSGRLKGVIPLSKEHTEDPVFITLLGKLNTAINNRASKPVIADALESLRTYMNKDDFYKFVLGIYLTANKLLSTYGYDLVSILLDVTRSRGLVNVYISDLNIDNVMNIVKNDVLGTRPDNIKLEIKNDSGLGILEITNFDYYLNDLLNGDATLINDVFNILADYVVEDPNTKISDKISLLMAVV